MLFSSDGRSQLRQAADSYRQKEQRIAAEQYDGTYRFARENVLEWDKNLLWNPDWVEIEVCDIRARITHTKSPVPGNGSKKIILVHGNPSWGYIWRNITPSLTAAGHEVFSIDWLGHGVSDKPLSPREISIELHMHTLIKLVRHFDLHDFYIAAHDWGGCVVLCTLPAFPAEHKCAGLVLLNTFFPARPRDISLHYYLLYCEFLHPIILLHSESSNNTTDQTTCAGIWFFSTGILGSRLPDNLILRFMAPNLTTRICDGYSTPFRQHPSQSKASINRFAHIVPGTPDLILAQRQRPAWRMLEGLVGPEHFTINAQAALACRDVQVRKWWCGETLKDGCGNGKVRFDPDMDRVRSAPGRVLILFGRDDPLLPGFRRVLVDTIKVSRLVQNDEGGWIDGAGHYPMEQKPELIARSINEFLEQR